MQTDKEHLRMFELVEMLLVYLVGEWTEFTRRCPAAVSVRCHGVSG